MRALQTAGVPNAKIGIGIPFYGRLWTATTAPLQTGGAISKIIYYRDVPSTYWSGAFTHQWDSTFSADYSSNTTSNEFASYNGSQSIRAAVAWMKAEGFGGMMAFATDHEYVGAASGDDRYPLSTALCDAVFGSCPAGP